MRKPFFFIVAFLVITPLVTAAAEFRGGEQVRLMQEEPIEDNTYVAAGDVLINSPINGDLFVTGGNIHVSSQVRDDLFVAGGDIRIEGVVQGDLRVAGGNVTIDSNVNGEVLIAGGNVEIAPGASVGEVHAAAGQLTLAGTSGPVRAEVGTLSIEESAVIQGDLSYSAEEEARIASGATIEGETNRRLRPMPERPQTADWVRGGLLWFLSSLIMLLLFAYFLPNKSTMLVQEWRNNFAMNLLWGLIFLIIAPIVVVLLLISIIGIPLGIGILLVYIIMLYLGKLVATLAVGAWVRSIWARSNGTHVDWIAALIGLALMTLIGVIPVIGAIAVFVAFLAGLGVLVSHDWRLYARLRQAKEF